AHPIWHDANGCVAWKLREALAPKARDIRRDLRRVGELDARLDENPPAAGAAAAAVERAAKIAADAGADAPMRAARPRHRVEDALDDLALDPGRQRFEILDRGDFARGIHREERVYHASPGASAVSRVRRAGVA